MLVTLINGLDEDSRFRRKMSGQKISLENQLLALILDSINIRVWQNTKDGQKGRKRPPSLYKKLMGKDKPKDELMSFSTPEEYEEWRRRKNG